MVDAIREGLQERRVERDKEDVESDMEGGRKKCPAEDVPAKALKKPK